MQAPGLGGGKVLDSGGGRSLSSKSKTLRSPAFCLAANCFQSLLWKNALHSARVFEPLSMSIQVSHGHLFPRADMYEAHSSALHSHPEKYRRRRWSNGGENKGGEANLTSTSYWGLSGEGIILGCHRKMQRNWWLLFAPVARNATPSVSKHYDRRLPAEKRPLRMAVSATTPCFFRVPFPRWMKTTRRKYPRRVPRPAPIFLWTFIIQTGKKMPKLRKLSWLTECDSVGLLRREWHSKEASACVGGKIYSRRECGTGNNPTDARANNFNSSMVPRHPRIFFLFLPRSAHALPAPEPRG